MARAKKPKSPALRNLYNRYIGDDPDRQASIEEERANLDIAIKISQLRTKAGLTQRQLAMRVGTTASVVCRLEDADYEGHSLAMLRRIAAALQQRVEICFRPLKAKATHA